MAFCTWDCHSNRTTPVTRRHKEVVFWNSDFKTLRNRIFSQFAWMLLWIFSIACKRLEKIDSLTAKRFENFLEVLMGFSCIESCNCLQTFLVFQVKTNNWNGMGQHRHQISSNQPTHIMNVENATLSVPLVTSAYIE